MLFRILLLFLIPILLIPLQWITFLSFFIERLLGRERYILDGVQIVGFYFVLLCMLYALRLNSKCFVLSIPSS